MDGFRAFMVKTYHLRRHRHRGSQEYREYGGHTFISILYGNQDPFDHIVGRIREALKTQDGRNMPETPAVAHRIKAIYVNWQETFGDFLPSTELTSTNCDAVMKYLAGAKHPYYLDVTFERVAESEELPSYSSLEGKSSSTLETEYKKKFGSKEWTDKKKPS